MPFKPAAVLGQFCGYFCRRKAAVVLRKMAGGLRFDCGQYGSFAIFAVYLRLSAVLCGCTVAENRGLNRMCVKGMLRHFVLEQGADPASNLRDLLHIALALIIHNVTDRARPISSEDSFL